MLVSATQHNSSDRLALSLTAAERAHDVAEAIGRTDLMLSADEWRANNLYHLGRVAEALAEREHGVAAYRRAGLIARAVAATEHLAWLCAAAGQVDRCLTLASAGVDEATALGLKQQAAACGDPASRRSSGSDASTRRPSSSRLSVAWDSSTDVTAACSPSCCWRAAKQGRRALSCKKRRRT